MNDTININTTLTVPVNITSIVSSVELFDLSIRVYSATKSDKDVNLEVAKENNANINVGNYQKKLLQDCKTYAAVVSFAGEVRRVNQSMTVPWNRNGTSMVHGAIRIDHVTYIQESQRKFWELVEEFLLDFEDAIDRAAFSLGTLFNRADYPSLDEVREKFGFSYMYMPMPASGDFRVDVGSAATAEMIEHFEHVFQQRMSAAMRDVWDRLYDIIKRISDKLDEKNFDGSREDGKKTKLHETLLTNAEDFIGLLDALNITGNPDLTKAGKDLERIIGRADIKELKTDASARADVKMRVDEILNRFNF